MAETANRVPLNKKTERTKKSKETICNAAIWCLDKYGYTETSIQRIVEQAEVSRGALTHHFPSKEDLIVESVERLLQRTMDVGWQGKHPESNIRDILKWIWKNLDTMQGRALVEVLMASRTDTRLNARISKNLIKWNTTIGENLLRNSQQSGPEDDEIILLFEVCRTFFRGLLVHKSFVANEEDLAKIADKFIDIISPYFKQ